MRKDGTRFWGDVVITALHDDAGNLTGYAKVTRDRTDLKALEDAQDAFYAAFNHDFRTPVTAMKGFVDAIRDADRRGPDRISSTGWSPAPTDCSGMVEGLVAVRQPARGAGRPPSSWPTSTWSRSRAARSHDLARHLDPGRVQVADDVALATANGVAMHRVITNLVVNALKYSPPGSPSRSTSAVRRRVPDRSRSTDRGRGIDPDDLDVIFDEFVRGRLAEDDGGTGLGLASVRELVASRTARVSIAERGRGGHHRHGGAAVARPPEAVGADSALDVAPRPPGLVPPDQPRGVEPDRPLPG